MNTQLTDRVAKWQAKLAPILEEEELRAEFDIHKYSTQVIEMAQKELQREKRKIDGSVQVRKNLSVLSLSLSFYP